MSAPDYIEPVIGYRAWRVDRDARLRAWTAETAWKPGVNRAHCNAGRFGVRGRRRHSAPDQDCMCGLYALNECDDARLAAADVRGAIAAWGSVQVHRTGFRAEFACVVALAADDAADAWKRWRLEAVARAYGVPLVAAGELEAAARAHGAPLAYDGLPTSRPSSPDSASLPEQREGLGRMVEHHLWVREEDDELVVGLGRALSSQLAEGELVAPRAGQRLTPGGEMAAVLSASGPLILPAPVSGEIVAVNPGLDERGDGEPEGQAWLLRLTPSRWPEEARDLSWGSRGDRLYGALLATRSSGVDVFEELRPEFRRAARTVRSFADVRAALDALRRGKPRFADAHAFDAQILGVLGPRLREDNALRGHLARANATIALRVRDLEADVWFDLRPPSASVEIRTRTGEPDVLIELDADLAADYLLGRADLVGAIRRREASLRGERGHALVLLSVLSELVRPSQANGHRRRLPVAGL
ncbi:MAG: hypothetical protein ACR2ML_02245 [Solirubrobacteraceae bacterium]